MTCGRVHSAVTRPVSSVSNVIGRLQRRIWQPSLCASLDLLCECGHIGHAPAVDARYCGAPRRIAVRVASIETLPPPMTQTRFPLKSGTRPRRCRGAAAPRMYADTVFAGECRSSCRYARRWRCKPRHTGSRSRRTQISRPMEIRYAPSMPVDRMKSISASSFSCGRR